MSQETEIKQLMQKTGFPEMFSTARRRCGTASGFIKLLSQRGYKKGAVTKENIWAMEAGELVPDQEMAKRLADSLWFFKRDANEDSVAAIKDDFIKKAAAAEEVARDNGLAVLMESGAYKSDDLLDKNSAGKYVCSGFLYKLIGKAIEELKQHNSIEGGEIGEEVPGKSFKEPLLLARELIIARWGSHLLSEYRQMKDQSLLGFAKSLEYEGASARKSREDGKSGGYKILVAWGTGERVLNVKVATAVAKALVKEKAIKPSDEEAAIDFFTGKLRFYEKELVTSWEEEAWSERDNGWRMQQLRLNQGYSQAEFAKQVRINKQELAQAEISGAIDDGRTMVGFIKAYAIPEEDQQEFRERFSASKRRDHREYDSSQAYGDVGGEWYR